MNGRPKVLAVPNQKTCTDQKWCWPDNYKHSTYQHYINWYQHDQIPFVEELEGEVIDGDLADAKQCFRDVLDQPNSRRHFRLVLQNLSKYVQLYLLFTLKLCQAVIPGCSNSWCWHFEVSFAQLFLCFNFFTGVLHLLRFSLGTSAHFARACISFNLFTFLVKLFLLVSV